MSETNDTSIRLVREATRGTTPANPKFRQYCHTGAGFASNPVQTQDPRICGNTSSRALETPHRTGEQPTGTLPGLLDAAHADLLDAVIQGVWNRQNFRTNTVSGTTEITDISSGVITVTSGTAFAVDDLVFIDGTGNAEDRGLYRVTAGGATSLTVSGIADNASPPATMVVHKVGVQSSSGDLSTSTGSGNQLVSAGDLDFTADVVVEPGDWVRIGGAATANKFDTAVANGWCRVSAVASGALTFDRVPTGFAADAGTGKTIRLLVGDSVHDGKAKSWFTAEMDYLTDSDAHLYNYFPGVMPDGISITSENRETASTIQASIGFTGITPSEPTETRETGATTLLPPVAEPYRNGIDLIRIAEGGSPVTNAEDVIVNFSLEVNNNNRRRGGHGYDAGADMASGDLNVSGTLEPYFNDIALLNKVKGGTETNIDFILGDPKHNSAMVFDLPRVVLTGDPSAGGRNADHTLPLTYTAHPDATLGYAIKAQFFHATNA